MLMDVQMPRMDGPTATRFIRERELAQGRRRTPIIALTANAMTHQVKEYLAAGMDGFVAKPIEVDAPVRGAGSGAFGFAGTGRTGRLRRISRLLFLPSPLARGRRDTGAWRPVWVGVLAGRGDAVDPERRRPRARWRPWNARTASGR